MAIESAAEFHDFQAEYEGSIPFTRSNVFKGLTHAPKFILTNPNFHSDKCSLFGRFPMVHSAMDSLACAPNLEY
jgi:hypothetical protein